MLTYKKKYSMTYDEQAGCIISLKYGDKEYVGEKIGIFRIALRNEEADMEYAEVSDMQLLTYQSDDSGFCAQYAGAELRVSVICRLAEELQWQIKIENNGSKILEWVNFPQIAVPNTLKDQGGDSKILWGFNEGCLIEDMKYKEEGAFSYKEPCYPSEGAMALYPAIVQSQLLAYYDRHSGLYLGAHDSQDHLKGIDLCPYGKGVLLQFRHFCGVDYGCDYHMPFYMVMKFFEGSWHDAAQIYKDWMQKERKDHFCPISQNTSLPKWYSQSPVVVTYPVRGQHDGDVMEPNKLFPYCNALPHIERLERELNSKIMVILMHWEGTAPWAPPYVWPPFGGETALRSFIDALHARGDLLGVYCSGLGWTQYSKIVEDYNREQEYADHNLQEVMCRSPKQELPYSNIVSFIRAGYDMCPAHPFVEKTLSEQVGYMVSAGIDYIQLMDQNHGGTSYFCYSNKHGHPPEPGKWQVDAVKSLLKNIREKWGDIMLGCESAAAEAYIPNLLFSDNRFELAYGAGKPVPLYAYLYHQYINNFMGNQVSANSWLDHKGSPVNLLERIAYSFAAGDMMTLVLNENGNIAWNWGWREVEHIPNQQEIKTFVKNANSWRYGYGKKYLHTGSMVKPIPMKEQYNTIRSVGDCVFTVDRIHSSAWLSEDGQFGQFLINYNPEEVTCEITIPEGTYWLRKNEADRIELNSGINAIKIDPLSVLLIERGL